MARSGRPRVAQMRQTDRPPQAPTRPGPAGDAPSDTPGRADL